MVSLTAFTALVGLVAVQRVWEVARSRRHERALAARGAREYARWQTPMLAVLHTAWLASMCLEAWIRQPAVHPGMAAGALAVLALGQCLRSAAMRTLGDRWTIRVMTLPGSPPVTNGIYRYLRHPNYLGVVLEIAALPLVHGAIYTAVTFSALNALALAARIHAEEQALATDNAYLDRFVSRSRFLPTRPQDRRPS